MKYRQGKVWKRLLRKRLLLNIWHIFAGHPKEDSVAVGELSVRCRCGKIISLYDYY